VTLVPLVASVNIASAAVVVDGRQRESGIAKQPTSAAVEIRDPGPRHDGLGSGLVGDVIGDPRHHGGAAQAVYAYARESLDFYAARLGRQLPNGTFGENLTTLGVDVDGAVLGERWQVGHSVVLQVTEPRIPCATFRAWIGEPGWLRQFTAGERPGAYLRVVHGGMVRSGDAVTVERPDHAVTIALAFRALLRQPTLLPKLLAAEPHLTDELRAAVARGRAYSLDG
jgi:MOSC domain-containing protein YiiM